jgi:hypothetical protein
MSIFLLPELKYNKAPLLQCAQNQTNWNDNPIRPGAFSILWGEETEYIDPMFDEIRQKFKDQSIVIGACFMKIKPQSVFPPHVDPGRPLGVNFPLSESFENSGVDIYSNNIVVSQVFSECPYIIDTSITHGAHNTTDEETIFLSLSFSKDIDFAQLVKWQLEGELLI